MSEVACWNPVLGRAGLSCPSPPPSSRTAVDVQRRSHVMLPRELSKQVPKTHLMSEEEWRRLGVQQSLGWVHYMIHEPEPHILLFRRPLPKDQQK
nr:PREDICTED: cyclin-dependent kinases regulatory subunit 2 isoform X1 [Equus przewalskii]